MTPTPPQFVAANSCNQHIAKLQAYRVTSQDVWHTDDIGNFVKADWNESGINPSPRVLEALHHALQSKPMQWYPDVEATYLCHALAEYCKCNSSMIRVFTGSDAALEYVCRSFLNPGDEVLMRIPTYDNFRVYAEQSGAVIKSVSNESPFVLEHQEIIDAITNKTKIIYLVNPCNPTGITYTQKEIENIISAAPHALIIIDEAYFEFWGKTSANLVHRYSNIVVSRSFSKALALAGLRIGYLIAQEPILEIIDKIRIGKNVSSLAQIAAVAAITDKAYTQSYVAETKEAQKWLATELRGLGFEVRETVANFILVHSDDPTGLASHLKNEQIYVRDRSFMHQMSGYIRVTIGTMEQAQKIRRACEHYIELRMIMGRP